MSDTWSEVKTFLKREKIPFKVTYPDIKPDPWYGKYYDIHFPKQAEERIRDLIQKGYFRAMRVTITFKIDGEIVA